MSYTNSFSFPSIAIQNASRSFPPRLIWIVGFNSSPSSGTIFNILSGYKFSPVPRNIYPFNSTTRSKTSWWEVHCNGEIFVTLSFALRPKWPLGQMRRPRDYLAILWCGLPAKNLLYRVKFFLGYFLGACWICDRYG